MAAGEPRDAGAMGIAVAEGRPWRKGDEGGIAAQVDAKVGSVAADGAALEETPAKGLHPLFCAGMSALGLARLAVRVDDGRVRHLVRLHRGRVLHLGEPQRRLLGLARLSEGVDDRVVRHLVRPNATHNHFPQNDERQLPAKPDPTSTDSGIVDPRIRLLKPTEDIKSLLPSM